MPETVADMMADFAAAAVETARAMNVTLDYSEESLRAVEGILQRCPQVRATVVLVSSAGGIFEALRTPKYHSEFSGL